VQAGPIPNPKDAVEDALHDAVCGGQIRLRAARREIATNWIKAAATLGIHVAEPSATSAPAGQSAWCTATASYNSRYGDWDVLVHSNRPDATVTASGGGHSHTWHTDANGYADVYLRGPPQAKRSRSPLALPAAPPPPADRQGPRSRLTVLVNPFSRIHEPACEWSNRIGVLGGDGACQCR
jgi:hypothetical protein